MPPDAQALLDRPLAELNLSYEPASAWLARPATIGELIRKTGDDLLECKNFGVTSLNEVREKLTLMGLKLRGDYRDLFRFELTDRDPGCTARRGCFSTPHGEVRLPRSCRSGTQGAVKGLTVDMLRATGANDDPRQYLSPCGSDRVTTSCAIGAAACVFLAGRGRF